MSAMPAEAEPSGPGPEVEPPMTRPKTATRPETAEPPIANAVPVQRLTGHPRATQARTATTGAAAFRTTEAEPAGAVRALRPATVRPRQVGLIPSPAPRRPRPAGLRLRRVSTRLHPTGVRACSDVLRAEPPAVALPIRRPRPSLPGDVPQRLRLTRRGRVAIAVFGAVVMSLVGLASAGGTRTAGPAAPAGGAGHSMARIVVQPGQTLWTIAVRADPQADPRLVVQRIITANALRNGSVQAGQSLLVPRS